MNKILSGLFLLAIVLPLAYLFADSFMENGMLTLEHYVKAYNPQTFSLLLKSIALAFFVALAATAIGGVIGFILSRMELPFSEFLKLLLLLPLFVSPYYLAVAWRDVLFLFHGNVSLLRTETAVGLILLFCYAPISMLMFSASFASINSRLEDAALLVTGRQRVFRDILFPLVRPAMVSSFILIFILTISEITVPSYFIVRVFSTELFQQFTAFYDHKAAMAMGALICALSFALLLTERNFLADAPFLAVGKRGSLVKKIKLGKRKYVLLLLFTIYISIVVFIPLVLLSMQAFKEPMPEYLIDRTRPGGYMPLDRPLGYSLHFIQQGFALLKPALSGSVIYALAGSLLACIFGFSFAYYSERKKRKWGDYMLLLIFAIPSTLFGIALVKFYNRPSLDFIYASATIILLVYVGKYTFIGSRIIGNSIKQIPVSLEEAATLTGAGFTRTLRNVLFPLLSKSFFIAFLVCFIFMLGEMAATIIVYPPGKALLAIRIATSMHNTPDGLISAMVLLVLLFTFSLLAILFSLQHLLTKKVR